MRISDRGAFCPSQPVPNLGREVGKRKPLRGKGVPNLPNLPNLCPCVCGRARVRTRLRARPRASAHDQIKKTLGRLGRLGRGRWGKALNFPTSFRGWEEVGNKPFGGAMEDVIAKMRTDFDMVAHVRCEAGHWSRDDVADASRAIKAAIASNALDLILCWARWLADLSARDLVEATTLPPESPAKRECKTCRHFAKPGRADGYCGGREDLAHAYGEGHPLRVLPDDGGVSCRRWEGLR